MVTGDNLETAVAIAKECGILTDGGTVLTGSDFRAMTPAQLDKALPTLQVPAHCLNAVARGLVAVLAARGVCRKRTGRTLTSSSPLEPIPYPRTKK